MLPFPAYIIVSQFRYVFSNARIQPRATNPPTWDEAAATAAAASAGRAGEDMPVGGGAESRGGRGAGGTSGKGAEAAVVRPVWLALAAGRLFLREKVNTYLTVANCDADASLLATKKK